MIGEYVSRARIVDITPSDAVPGLYDLLLEDGTRLNDLTTRQTQAFVDRNGLVPRFSESPPSSGQTEG